MLLLLLLRLFLLTVGSCLPGEQEGAQSRTEAGDSGNEAGQLLVRVALGAEGTL